MPSLHTLDTELFQRIKALAGHDWAVDRVMVDWALYAPVVFALLLVAVWLSWRPRNQFGAFLAGAAALLALGIGQFVGMALPRLRPYEAPRMVHVALLIHHSSDTSFPSDHATLAFAITAALWRVDRRLGVLSLLLSLWLAVARVYVGAHYPSDVAGGAVLGTAVAAAMMWLSGHPPMQALLNGIFGVLRRLHLAAGSGGAEHARFGVDDPSE